MDDDKTLFLVLSNPTAGMEEEYNEWYDTVHVPEVLATPGMVSAQRFALRETEASRASGAEPAHRYLAVYEMKGDPDVVMGHVREAMASGVMHLHEALDLSSSVMSFWRPIGPRVES